MYRRRRLSVAVVLTAIVVGPCWSLSRSDGGDVQNEAVDRRSAEGAARGDAVGSVPTSASTCEAQAQDLPVRARLALLVMVGVDGDDVAGVEALLQGPDRPGGVFVARGTAVWDDRALVGAVEDGLPLLVAVDDEGGRVQRLSGILPDLPSAAEMSELEVEVVKAMAAERAAQLQQLGATMVFAPVLDLGEGGGIGDRSFGSDPAVVASYAGAYADGLREGGILPVAKHFPGEGRASGDPHESPVVAPPLELLRAAELLPYEALLGAGPIGVMVGHLDVAGLTADGVPASLSPDAIGLLRAGYEFDGLVVTDDLVQMAAVTDRFSVPEAAERAIAAGADLVLLAHPTDRDAVLDRLVEAVEQGRLPERRVSAAIGRVAAAAGCA